MNSMCAMTGSSASGFIRTVNGSYCSRMCHFNGGNEEYYIDRNESPDEFCQDIQHQCKKCNGSPDCLLCDFCITDAQLEKMILGDFRDKESNEIMTLYEDGRVACKACAAAVSQSVAIEQKINVCVCQTMIDDDNRRQYYQGWINARLDLSPINHYKAQSAVNVSDPRLVLLRTNQRLSQMHKGIVNIITSYLDIFSSDETLFQGVVDGDYGGFGCTLNPDAIRRNPLFDVGGISSCIVYSEAMEVHSLRVSRNDDQDITLDDVWVACSYVPQRAQWVEHAGEVVIMVII